MRSIQTHKQGDIVIAMTEKGMFTLRKVGLFGVVRIVNGTPIGEHMRLGTRHVKVLCKDQDKAIAKAEEAGADTSQLYQVILVGEELSGNYQVPVFDTVPIDYPKPRVSHALIKEATEQGEAIAEIIQSNDCQDNTQPEGMA